MLKYILILLMATGIFVSDVAAEEINKQLVEMPEGFEGIYLGISIKELLKIRPKANLDPMDRYSPSQEIDVTKPNQTLGEFTKGDPLFGLNMVSMYVFRDGKLKNMLLTWVGDISHVRKHREKFVSSCSKRWGTDYQKKIIKFEPKKKNEHLAPLLLWQVGNTIIAAVCTSEYEDKSLEEGAFMISMFSKNDRETLAAFAGEKVHKSLRDKLFLKIGIAPSSKSKESQIN
jgi:hypothetical protein